MSMYSCIFTYECVYYYVIGQRWHNKQVKSLFDISKTYNFVISILYYNSPNHYHTNQFISSIDGSLSQCTVHRKHRSTFYKHALTLNQHG